MENLHRRHLYAVPALCLGQVESRVTSAQGRFGGDSLSGAGHHAAQAGGNDGFSVSGVYG